MLLRKSLRDLDAIVPTLRELGARHVAYGARPEHYPVYLPDSHGTRESDTEQ